MAKTVKKTIRLHLPAGQATPAPPVGTALAPHGVNLGEFTQKFNELTRERQGFKIPVDISIYEDRTFDLKLHEPPAAELIKKAIGLEKGSGTPNKTKVGKISNSQLEEIAKQKMTDLNTDDLEEAKRIIAGTAGSMGIEVQ